MRETMSNLRKVKIFKLVGGDLSLDFVNTVADRTSGPGSAGDHQSAFRREYLENYGDLIQWSTQVKLLDDDEARKLLAIAEESPRQAETAHRRALVLREALYRLFKSAIEARKPLSSDLEKLNKELAIANKHMSIIHDGDGFSWKPNIGESLDCMLWHVALSAAEILTAGDRPRLRQCVGDPCGWVFLDQSRNRSRQWCDMRDCGNLAKVRRFRQKTT